MHQTRNQTNWSNFEYDANDLNNETDLDIVINELKAIYDFTDSVIVKEDIISRVKTVMHTIKADPRLAHKQTSRKIHIVASPSDGTNMIISRLETGQINLNRTLTPLDLYRFGFVVYCVETTYLGNQATQYEIIIESKVPVSNDHIHSSSKDEVSIMYKIHDEYAKEMYEKFRNNKRAELLLEIPSILENTTGSMLYFNPFHGHWSTLYVGF